MKTHVLLVATLLVLVGAASAPTEAAITYTPDKDFDWNRLAPKPVQPPKTDDLSDLGAKPVQEPLTYTPVEDPGFLDRAASAVWPVVLLVVLAVFAVVVMLRVRRIAVYIEKRRTRRLEARPLGGSMKTPLKIMSAAALLLALLFAGPIVYRTGHRVGLWLNCPYGDVCWAEAGHAVMHGGRLPRR